MNGGQIGDGALALFLFGVLLFSPAMLSLFRSSMTIFGLPLLYLYLFGAWLVLIGLLSLIARRIDDQGAPHPPSGADGG